MDRVGNQMQLYLDETYLGQAAADFGSQPFLIFSIANFANPAGSSRNLIGTIDAVAISDELLDPGSFVLAPSASVVDWQIFD